MTLTVHLHRLCFAAVLLLSACSPGNSSQAVQTRANDTAAAALTTGSSTLFWRKLQIEENSYQLIHDKLGAEGALHLAKVEPAMEDEQYTLWWLAPPAPGQSASKARAFRVKGDIHSGKVLSIECRGDDGRLHACYAHGANASPR